LPIYNSKTNKIKKERERNRNRKEKKGEPKKSTGSDGGQ
jgi:hypothetical protein